MMKELKEIINSINLSDEIEAKLPDDQHIGYTLISLVIDKYSLRMGIPTREAWKMMYSIAMAVCDDLGEYGEDTT